MEWGAYSRELTAYSRWENPSYAVAENSTIRNTANATAIYRNFNHKLSPLYRHPIYTGGKPVNF